MARYLIKRAKVDMNKKKKKTKRSAISKPAIVEKEEVPHVSKEVKAAVERIQLLLFKKRILIKNMDYLHNVDTRPQYEKLIMVREHVEELILVETQLGADTSVMNELDRLLDEIDRSCACDFIDSTTLNPGIEPPAFKSNLNANAVSFVPSPEFIMSNRELCHWYDHYCTVLYPHLEYDLYKTMY
jgi:hypothetical protein